MLTTTLEPGPVALDRPNREALLTALLADHGARIVRYLFGMVGDMATAEDLAQDSFLRAAERLHQVEDPDRAAGWLFAIAANAARQHLRRGRRWRWLPWTDEVVQPETRSGLADGPESMVSAVLSRLATPDREMLLLVGLVGLTATEAAEVVGISKPAAHKRWQRACERFRAALAEEEQHAL